MLWRRPSNSYRASSAAFRKAIERQQSPADGQVLRHCAVDQPISHLPLIEGFKPFPLLLYL
jgi:hypothetical protein